MLTFEDCLALCELSAEEISAIAEHENLPEIAALEYGEYLMHLPDGDILIRDIIIDDIKHCKTMGNMKHAEDLEAVLRHFISTHPKLKSYMNS